MQALAYVLLVVFVLSVAASVAAIAIAVLLARRGDPPDQVDARAETAMAVLSPDEPLLDDASRRRQLQRLDCNPDACLASRQAHRREAASLSDAQSRMWDQICRDLEGINR